ncbi:YodL domain-containing protein [Clostridium sp. CX1]|uniref:YodL domain-containing protein n=1 Tax=Clostridium sp. CX1 TaxID=2978346 RepID=UPI0021C06F72|nr:YodL domain-containing protein [Clostridium sp. CX1]MCT8974996.1 YodL domain-containing protein [Clostridium sp. CX1]
MKNEIRFRLYQINKDLPIDIIEGHLSLETTEDIDPKIYRLTWESLENSDLEALYNKYNTDNRPNNYVCRSISTSDIVEIEDENNTSIFYLCSNFGWTEIEFDKNQVPPEMGFDQWYINTDMERRKSLRMEMGAKAVVQIMVQRLKKSNRAVLSKFKSSKTYENLYDEKTKLWSKSPYYVADVFEKEIEEKENN